MKREYNKPAVEIIEMETQQMICQSGDEMQYRLKKDDETEWDEYTGEFE